MKKFLQTLLVLTVFVLPLFLSAEFTYLSDEEYEALNSTERDKYLNDLDNEMISLQERKVNAINDSERLIDEIDALRLRQIENDRQIQALYRSLGITEQDLADMRSRIQYYKDQLANRWEKMSDDELWRNARAFKELNEDYDETKQNRLARLPEFRRDFNDLDRRFAAINDALNRARKTSGYYEDSYIVRRGDSLSKISGYDFIYNDTSKWGIIYRANRDQIKDPNLIYPNQNLRIPRGLPPTWKVYRGESLWRISSYPEVYGTGTKWPTIYRANRDQIKDPNLIYPNQVFTIPRDDK